MGNEHTCYEAFRTGLRQRTRPKGIELDSREQSRGPKRIWAVMSEWRDVMRHGLDGEGIW
jgi:hypothetical protein